MIKSGKKILFKKVIFLTSVWQKATGLMFSRRIIEEAYVFIFNTPRRMDMHMLFVFFPIDVLFLDKGKNIIEFKESFKPFSFYYSNNPATYVIEIPDGSIKKHKLHIGEKLVF